MRIKLRSNTYDSLVSAIARASKEIHMRKLDPNDLRLCIDANAHRRLEIGVGLFSVPDVIDSDRLLGFNVKHSSLLDPNCVALIRCDGVQPRIYYADAAPPVISDERQGSKRIYRSTLVEDENAWPTLPGSESERVSRKYR